MESSPTKPRSFLDVGEERLDRPGRQLSRRRLQRITLDFSRHMTILPRLTGDAAVIDQASIISAPSATTTTGEATGIPPRWAGTWPSQMPGTNCLQGMERLSVLTERCR